MHPDGRLIVSGPGLRFVSAIRVGRPVRPVTAPTPPEQPAVTVAACAALPPPMTTAVVHSASRMDRVLGISASLSGVGPPGDSIHPYPSRVDRRLRPTADRIRANVMKSTPPPARGRDQP